MTRGISKKWQSLQSKAIRSAEWLVREEGRAVRLALLARKQGVMQFCLGPSLSEGELRPVKNGFIMHLRCQENEIDRFDRALHDESDLGTSLPHRIRFNIAHEIAHSLFYESQDDMRVSTVSHTHARTLDSLERTCNRVALRILMPSRLFDYDVEKRDVLDASVADQMRREYRVSGDVFVARLGWCSAWNKGPGVVAVVREQDGQPTFARVRKFGQACEFFSDVKVGDCVTSLICDRELLRSGISLDRKVTDLRCRYKGRIELIRGWSVSYRSIANSPRSFLLTVRP